jgi:hypothetical protein
MKELSRWKELLVANVKLIFLHKGMLRMPLATKIEFICK